MSVRQSADEIEADAARWVLRLDREGGAPELNAWLAGDTRRQGALLQAQAAWAMLDRGQWLAIAEPEPRQAKAARLPCRAVFAAAVIAAGLGAATMMTLPERCGTGVGEVRRLPLADGSAVAINTASAIRVDLGKQTRRVRLDHGEAWFRIAPDPSRPFLVAAGSVRVQAGETAFSVRRRDGGAEVLVTEGAVRVWVDGAEDYAVRLPAGSRAFVADSAMVTNRPGAPSEIDRQLAWRAGQIDLAGETLEHATGEFNRYNRRKLVVTDRVLARARLHGVFRTDDPEGFAGAVAVSLNAAASSSLDEIQIGARR